MRRTGFLFFGLMFVFAVSVFGDAGKTGWWILRRPQSTKPKPITAVASVRGDLSGVFYNPSILCTVTQRELFFMTELGLASDTFGGFVYGMPLKEGSGAAVGLVYYDAGKTTLNWMENGALNEASVSMQKDMLLTASYGRQLNRAILLGATLKAASSNIAELRSSTALCLDLGCMWFSGIAGGLVFSLAAQNIGSASKFIDKADELPLSIWAGCSYSMSLGAGRHLGIGVDLPYIVSEQRAVPVLGVEYGLGKFSANLGYKLGMEDSALQIGFNFYKEKYDIGYSLSPSLHLSYSHRLSVGYRF